MIKNIERSTTTSQLANKVKKFRNLVYYRQLIWAIAVTLSTIPAYFLAAYDLPDLLNTSFAITHLLLELPAAAIGLMVFSLAWTLLDREEGLRRSILGAGFLSVALIDVGHTISYPGMPVFLFESNANRSLFFWLIGCLIVVLTLLVTAIFSEKTISKRFSIGLISFSFLFSIAILIGGYGFLDLIPELFILGVGLTTKKIIFEYILAAIYVFVAILFFREGKRRQLQGLLWLSVACLVHSFAEIYFTFFSSLSDGYVVIGHVYKLLSSALIYRGYVYASIKAPYSKLDQEHSKLEALISSIPDPVWQKDIRGFYQFCNSAFAKMMGRTREEIIGKSDHDIVKSSLAKFYRHRDKIVLTRGRIIQNEEIIVQSDGSERLFETTKTPIYDINGTPLAVLGVAHDITDRRAVELELRLAAKILESNIPMVITDSSQIILRVNEALLKLTGYSEDELVGKNPAIFHTEDVFQSLYEPIMTSLEKHGQWQGEALGRRKNGEIYPKWLVIAAVIDSIGNVTHYVSTEQDLSEQRENMATIERLAFFDSVTELPNRRLMMDRLAKTISFVEEQGCQGALLHLDLDDFKIINDSYGHLYGDIVLKEIARRLKSCIDVTDTLSRTGGDEFVIILSQLSLNDAGTIEANELAKRVQEVLSQPFFLEEPETHRKFQYFCSVSIGIALFSTADVSADELLKHSDIALYNAKINGRGLIKFFNPTMQDLIITHSEILEDLHKALKQDQLFVQYQPQVNETGKVVGAEALVRWRHPELGMIAPNQFIPVAEESGLIVQVGQFVFESVCKQLALWKSDTQFSDITIAVNVSALQMKLPGLISGVKSILAKTGAVAHQIKLELTESMLLTNTDQIIGIMEELRKTGLKFSLDDFGTGYSSLSYLNRLPIDQIKIDQSFIANLMNHHKNQAIAQTIIQLGQNLGLSILAEGVELPAQLDFLVSHGCRLFQGYLFSKPLDIKEFEDFIRNANNQKAGESD